MAGDPRPPGRILLELARHRREAGEPAAAAAWLVRAAQAAFATGSPRAAHELCESALELLDQGDDDARPGGRDRAAARLCRGGLESGARGLVVAALVPIRNGRSGRAQTRRAGAARESPLRQGPADLHARRLCAGDRAPPRSRRPRRAGQGCRRASAAADAARPPAGQRRGPRCRARDPRAGASAARRSGGGRAPRLRGRHRPPRSSSATSGSRATTSATTPTPRLIWRRPSRRCAAGHLRSSRGLSASRPSSTPHSDVSTTHAATSRTHFHSCRIQTRNRRVRSCERFAGSSSSSKTGWPMPQPISPRAGGGTRGAVCERDPAPTDPARRRPGRERAFRRSRRRARAGRCRSGRARSGSSSARRPRKSGSSSRAAVTSGGGERRGGAGRSRTSRRRGPVLPHRRGAALVRRGPPRGRSRRGSRARPSGRGDGAPEARPARRARRGVSRDDAGEADPGARGPNHLGWARRTACVCVTRPTCFSASSWRSVSTTIVERPRCRSRERAWTWPSRTARKKFVFDSIVAVPPASSGRLRKAR